MLPDDSILRDDLRFAEQYLWVRPKGDAGAASGGLVRLVPNYAQRFLATHWSNRLIILKARQLGMSTWIGARFFRKAVTNVGMNALTIAHDPTATGNLFAMHRIFYDCLPEKMQPKRKYSNVRMMTFDDLRSTIMNGTAGNREFGRGVTTHLVHASEFAFWPKADVSIKALVESVPPRTPSTDIVIESTPNGAAGAFYEICMRCYHGEEQEWKMLFLPWWLDEQYRIGLLPGEVVEYDSEEAGLVAKHDLAPEQIKWRRFKIREAVTLLGTKEAFYQEYPEDPETCFLTGGFSFFPEPQVRVLLAQTPREPMRMEEVRGAPGVYWRVWREPEHGAEYVMAIDPASGSVGDDLAGVVVRDRRSNERVVTMNATISTFRLAEAAAELGERYNRALVAVERNGLGISVVEKMCELGYEQMYRETGSRKIGWVTTSSNRLPMLEDLRQEVIEGDAQFNDADILRQMLVFQRATSAGGRPEAMPGKHDDMVMADAICGRIRNVDRGGGMIL